MPRYDWPFDTTGNAILTFEVALPLLTIGSNDIAVTWPQPFANTAYVVPKPGIEGGGLTLGKSEAVLKDGTRTTTGCTVTVVNTGLVSIAAGAKLHVCAVGQLS